MRDPSRYVTPFAFLLLAIALFFLVRGSPHWWWPGLSGGVLVLALRRWSRRALPGRPGSGVSYVVLFWAAHVILGALVEGLRVGLSLWSYASPYETPLALGAFVLVGYPAMGAFALLLFLELRRGLSLVTAFAMTFAVFLFVHEAGNALAPLWNVPEENATLLYPLFVFGYLIECALPVALWTVITGTARNGPEDTVFWRALRAMLLARMRDSIRRVLSTRLIPLVGGPDRPLISDLDDLADGLEPAAVELRPHAQLGQLPRLGNRLMVEMAVYTLAGYRVLRHHGFGQVEARGAIADVGWDIYRTMLAFCSFPARVISRDPAWRLRATVGTLLRFPFSAPGSPGYAVEVWQEGGNLHTLWTHCPPQSFARRVAEAENDAEALQAFSESWCRYDWPGADLIASDGERGHYARPHTLSEGGPYCDMCWMGTARFDSSAGAR